MHGGPLLLAFCCSLRANAACRHVGLPQAAELGVAAVLACHEVPSAPAGLPVLYCGDTLEALSSLADAFYGVAPPLRCSALRCAVICCAALCCAVLLHCDLLRNVPGPGPSSSPVLRMYRRTDRPWARALTAAAQPWRAHGVGVLCTVLWWISTHILLAEVGSGGKGWSVGMTPRVALRPAAAAAAACRAPLAAAAHGGAGGELRQDHDGLAGARDV